MPLEILLDILTKRGMVIDWKDFYKTSLSYGCNPSTVIHKIESAIGDYFGSKYREEVIKRIKIIGF